MPMAVIGLVLFCLMALLMSLSYHALESLAEREVEERMLESASQMAQQLANELKQVEQLGDLLATQAKTIFNNPNINIQSELLAGLQVSSKEVVFSPDTSQAAIFLPPIKHQSKVFKQQMTSLSPLLEAIYNSHGLIDLAYVNTADSATAVYPWLDVVKLFPSSLNVKSLKHYYLADKANNPMYKAIWTSSYSDPSNSSRILTLSYPIVLEDKVLGVAGLDISLDTLGRHLAKMPVPWSGYSILMARRGQLLVFPHQAEGDWKDLQKEDLASQNLPVNSNAEIANLLEQPSLRAYLDPLRLDASGLITLNLNGQDVLLSWASVTPTGWKLINVASTSKVFAVKNQLTADYRLVLSLGGAFLLVMFLLLVFFVIRRDQQLAIKNQVGLLKKEDQLTVISSSIIDQTDFMDLVTGPLMVCQFDSKGLIIACNSAFEHLAGSTQSNLKDHNLLELLGLKSLVVEGARSEVELRVGQQEAASYWISLHYSAAGEGLLLLLDISEYKQIQQQLKGDRQRARLAARMKAEFFQVAVNDANELLVELLKNARGFDENLTEYCQNKLMEVQHLLDDMRDMSDTGEESKKELAEDVLVLSSLVNDCYTASESLLVNSGRRLLIEYGANIPENLVLDRRRLFRLMRHLLRQMIQLSAKGDIYLWLGWNELGRLQVKIYDQGGGLPESERLRRFQLTTPMSSSYEAASGALGLGQLLTRQLVHEMRGSLEVKALAAGGLQLQIELPARLAGKTKLPVLGRILVVDDGPVNTMLASSVLEKSGYQVDVASSGAEALKLGQQQEYDLVLMDIFMPDMDGLEAAGHWRQLSGKNAEIPVIALTANAMELERERFLQQGMDDYLTKPYRPNELRELVQRWLKK